MSQHDFNIANQGFPATRADLNNALQALASNSSGDTEPSTTFANQWWYETDTNTLKLRNEANNAWLSFATVDQTTAAWTLAHDVDITGTLTSDGLTVDKGSAGTLATFTDGVNSNFVVETSSLLTTIGNGGGSAALAFKSNNTTNMTLDASGNVGIGTTSPVSNLDVKGSNSRIRWDLGNAYTYQGATNSAGSAFAAAYYDGSEHRWLIASSTKAMIDSSGNVGIGTSSPSQKLDVVGSIEVSDGIYLGGTGSANYLSDYEQGTFTPTIIGTTTAGTGTYTTQVGAYTKVGRAVTIQIRLSWTAHTGTGFMFVSGLPFTTLSSGVQPSFTVGDARDIALTASNILQLFSDANTTTIQFIQTPTGGGASANVTLDTSATIILAGTYFV
jgi:hypothetical protein